MKMISIDLDTSGSASAAQPSKGMALAGKIAAIHGLSGAGSLSGVKSKNQSGYFSNLDGGKSGDNRLNYSALGGRYSRQ